MKLTFEFVEDVNCGAKLREELKDYFSPAELDEMSIEQMALEYITNEISSNLEYENIPLTMIDGKIIEED